MVIQLLELNHPTFTPVSEAIVKQFNEETRSPIRVELEQVSGSVRDQILVRVAAGNPPSVTRIDRFWTGSLAHSGVLQALHTNVLTRLGVKQSDLYPFAWNELVYKGQLYGLPSECDVVAMYANKAHFAESGLDPAKLNGATWEQLDQMSLKLDRQEDGMFTRVSHFRELGQWGFHGWLWAAGGELLSADGQSVTWNSPRGLRAATWMQDGFQRYYGRTPGAPPGGFFLSGIESMFISGRGYLEMVGSGKYPLGSQAGKDEVLVAPVPRPQGLEREPVTWSGGFALAIPSGAPYVNEALEFLAFSVGAKAQREWWAYSTPVNRYAIAGIVQDAGTKAFLSLAPYAKWRPVSAVGAELWQVYRTDIPRMITSEGKNPREVLEETTRRAQALVDGVSKGK